MKQTFSLFLLLFMTAAFLPACFAGDSTADRIHIYQTEKATIVPRETLMTQTDSGTLSADQTKTAYDILLGDDSVVYLSDIAFAMGNADLAKKIRLGENFPAFLAGLCVSIGHTLAAGIVGPILMAAYYVDPVLRNNTSVLAAGIITLSSCSISLGGIVTFAILVGKAKEYDMNFVQATALVNQYNKFLRKKLKIPGDIQLNYNHFNRSFGLQVTLDF